MLLHPVDTNEGIRALNLSIWIRHSTDWANVLNSLCLHPSPMPQIRKALRYVASMQPGDPVSDLKPAWEEAKKQFFT